MSVGTCFGLSGVFDDAELVGVVAWGSEGRFCGGGFPGGWDVSEGDGFGG